MKPVRPREGSAATAAAGAEPTGWRSRAAWRAALLAISIFFVAYELPDLLRAVGLAEVFRTLLGAASFSVVSLLWMAICVGGLHVAHRTGLAGALAELGLRASVPRGLAFGLLVTLPMLVGIGLTSDLASGLTPIGLLRRAAVGPFVEEVLFRGYLFRQLYARAQWGFWPAALFVAVPFGLAHSSQALAGELGLAALAGIVAITAGGSVFFSWLFLRWGFNLWVAIAVHGLMNLWWELFAVDATALGGMVSNVTRLLTIIAAVAVTLWRTEVPAEAERGPMPAGEC